MGGLAPVERDAVVSVLVGGVTSPALVAARALTLEGSPTERYLAALGLAPVPLALRRARAPLRVGALELAGGDALAVDLADAGAPGGAGAHRCPGIGASGPTRRLAVAAVREAEALGLRAVRSEEGRVGLAWGVRRVVLAGA